MPKREHVLRQEPPYCWCAYEVTAKDGQQWVIHRHQRKKKTIFVASIPGSIDEGMSREEIARVVGERLRAKREEAGLSQRTLARVTALPEQLISRYENGKGGISLWPLGRITQTIGTNLGDLFSGIVFPPVERGEKKR